MTIFGIFEKKINNKNLKKSHPKRGPKNKKQGKNWGGDNRRRVSSPLYFVGGFVYN